MNRKEIGNYGEEVAIRFLKKKGFKILERNFKSSRYGEIDVIAKDKGQIVFIEVKSKTSDKYGLPEEAFTYFKKRHLFRAIQNYFWTKKIKTDNWRIDLIAIDFSKGINQPQIRHFMGINL